jgi:hypothetical protein
MGETSTLKVPTDVRNRLRVRARREHLTQGELIDAMLTDREDTEFWAALAAAPPPSVAELDEVDAVFLATANDGGVV